MTWIDEKARGFGADRRGVIAILFAVMIVPIMTAMAVAVDMGQFLVMKQQLRAAIDAAALDIGGQPALTDAAATTEAKAFIAANYPALTKVGTITSITVTHTSTSVVIAANATMPTNFLQIIGYTKLDVSLNSTIAVKENYVELALVLDNTGSMSTMYGGMTGISGLKTAAATLINTLFAGDPQGKYVRIGVVPFTASVNVGTGYASSSWIDQTGQGSLTREYLNIPAGKNPTYLNGLLKNVSWGGCVRQRNEPYDVQDTDPTNNPPNTLFTPYFAPSEPSGLDNHYLSDGAWPNGTSQATIQSDIAKYTNATVTSPSSSKGPNYNCPVQPIIRLTNQSSALLTEIGNMVASGSTAVPAGLMWGWHLISPNGPFGDGAAYSSSNTVKVIILVTDGQNSLQGSSVYPTNGFNKSQYSAYGYLSGPHLNIYALPNNLVGSEDQANYNLDVKEAQLCANIKAVTDAGGNAGRIKIYAIGFGNSINSSALTLLQSCASGSSYFFYNATSEQLIATFKNIAIGLSALRVAQ